MTDPLVSIVIPVYNGSRYLAEALDSALLQTYGNCEILVVNDGSTDDTEDMALGYGDKIRYFAKENGGVATALNMAIENMHGEYFSWLSHDDVYYPYTIEEKMKALRCRGDMARIAWGDHDILMENTGEIISRKFSELFNEEQLTDSVFPILTGCIGGCDLLIHKRHFDRVGLFNENLRYTQDYDMWFRMFYGQRLVYINKPLYRVRNHDLQGTKTESEHAHAEDARLHLDFARKLNREDMVRMFGSAYKYYRRLYTGLPYTGNFDAIKIVFDMLIAESPPDILARVEKIKRFLAKRFSSQGRINRLCIFGAGTYGVRSYYDLMMLVDVDIVFSDNNPDKHGKNIVQGVTCLSPDELYESKETTLVIVAMKETDEVMKQLRERGCPSVVAAQELGLPGFHGNESAKG